MQSSHLVIECLSFKRLGSVTVKFVCTFSNLISEADFVYWFQNTVQADIARHQLETEAQKVQGAMLEKLGSGEQGKLRQEARLDRIRSIEAEIKSLQV